MEKLDSLFQDHSDADFIARIGIQIISDKANNFVTYCHFLIIFYYTDNPKDITRKLNNWV